MTTLIHEQNELTTRTITKMEPPEWLLAFSKEIDDKTFGKGFNCLAHERSCEHGSVALGELAGTATWGGNACPQAERIRVADSLPEFAVR